MNKDENVHKGHRNRLKLRFLKEGLDNFDTHTIVELLLYYGVPQKNTNELAHSLLDTFGSISKMFDAPYEELIKVKGVGVNIAGLIKFIPSIARIYLDDTYSVGVVLDSTDKMIDFLKNKYIGRTTEVVFLLCFDSKKKLLYCDIINEGIINASNITVRKVIEIALRVSATSVVISHNHPHGFSMPSPEDINATQVLKKSLNVVSIDLLDHIIIAQKDYTSLAKCGVMY